MTLLAIKMPPKILKICLIGLALYPYLLQIEVINKRKAIQDRTPKIEAMDLDNFEFDEVIIRDVVVMDTLVTF